MSSIEERLVRDIAEVTSGVVVTDSDLRRARTAVNNRLSRGREEDRRRSRASVAAAAAVAVLLVGIAAYLTNDGDDKAAPPAGPGPSPTAAVDSDVAFLTGEAPTPELLEGIWRLDNGGVVMRFAAPDLVFMDDSGRLFEDPGIQGSYAIDGDTVTVTVHGGPAGCGGQQLAMRASVPELGILRLVHTGPGSGACREVVNERWVMEQLLPASPIIAGLDFSTVRGWGPLTEPSRLYGTWSTEGGGHLLELAANGRYHVAQGSGQQVDSGDWSQTGSRLTLTSSRESVRCSAGDGLVLGEVQAVEPGTGTTAIRSVVRENACDVPWADATWFLIPSDGD